MNKSILNPFFRLSGGTFISQLLPFIFVPIIARIYTPSQFGSFAFTIGIVNVLANITNLRLEIPIIIPKEDKKGVEYFQISLISNLVFTTIALIVIILFKSKINTYANFNDENVLLTIPVISFIIGFNKSLYYYLNRKGNYTVMSISPIVRSLTTNLSNLIFSFNTYGLIISQLIGRIITMIFLGIKQFKELFKAQSFSRMKINIIENKKYPLIDTPTALISALNQNNINLIVNPVFGVATGGIFDLVNRILGSPINLISTSFLDVFKKEASEEYSQNGNARSSFNTIVSTILILTTIPFILVFYFRKELVTLILGNQWNDVSIYIGILLPMIFVKMIARPISFMFYIVDKQRLNLLGQFVNFILIALSGIIGYYFQSPLYFAYSLSFSCSMFYLLYIYLSYKFSRGITK